MRLSHGFAHIVVLCFGSLCLCACDAPEPHATVHRGGQPVAPQREGSIASAPIPNPLKPDCFFDDTPRLALSPESHQLLRNGAPIDSAALIVWLHDRYAGAPLERRVLRISPELATSSSHMRWLLPRFAGLQVRAYTGGQPCGRRTPRPIAQATRNTGRDRVAEQPGG